jgi:hypothetical protein
MDKVEKPTPSESTRVAPRTRAPVLLIAAILLLSSCTRMEAVKESGNTRAMISGIERNIVLPEESNRLGDYSRYYAQTYVSGKPYLVGVFLLDGAGEVRVVSESDLPVVLDGGCDVVHVEYDVTEERMVTICCQGGS